MYTMGGGMEFTNKVLIIGYGAVPGARSLSS